MPHGPRALITWNIHISLQNADNPQDTEALHPRDVNYDLVGEYAPTFQLPVLNLIQHQPTHKAADGMIFGGNVVE
jgi:hypothetical protein